MVRLLLIFRFPSGSQTGGLSQGKARMPVVCRISHQKHQSYEFVLHIAAFYLLCLSNTGDEYDVPQQGCPVIKATIAERIQSSSYLRAP